MVTTTRPFVTADLIDARFDLDARFDMPLYYVACPYSAGTDCVMRQRAEIASRATASLLASGYRAFNPLSHSVPMDEYLDGYDWLDIDIDILMRCQGLIVLAVPGWRSSVGVTREIAAARRAGLPVLYAMPNDGVLFVGATPPNRDKRWWDNWLAPIEDATWLVDCESDAGVFNGAGERRCGFCGESIAFDRIDGHIRECW